MNEQNTSYTDLYNLIKTLISTLCVKIGVLALYITLQHCNHGNDSISPYCMSNANCGKRRAVLQSGLFCAIHVVFKGN